MIFQEIGLSGIVTNNRTMNFRSPKTGRKGGLGIFMKIEIYRIVRYT